MVPMRLLVHLIKKLRKRANRRTGRDWKIYDKKGERVKSGDDDRKQKIYLRIKKKERNERKNAMRVIQMLLS